MILGHTKLTPHFRWREFAQRDGTPPPESMFGDYKRLCRAYLEPLRAEFGPVTIHSGYRSPSYNARVGGASRSVHMAGAGIAGVAADASCREGAPRDWYALLDALDPGGLGIYPSWVHVDTRAGRARW